MDTYEPKKTAVHLQKLETVPATVSKKPIEDEPIGTLIQEGLDVFNVEKEAQLELEYLKLRILSLEKEVDEYRFTLGHAKFILDQLTPYISRHL